MSFTPKSGLKHLPNPALIVAAVAQGVGRKYQWINSALRAEPGVNYPDAVRSIGATQLEVPVLQPIEGDMTLQNPGNPPTPSDVTTDKQIAPIAYLEHAVGINGFTPEYLRGIGISATEAMASSINVTRDRQVTQRAIAELDGIFASSDFSGLLANTSAGSYSVNEDPVNDAASNVYFDDDFFTDASHIIGADVEEFSGGVIMMHSKVRSYLQKITPSDFQNLNVGDITVTTFRSMIVVANDSLVRDGGTSGKVYQVYLCKPGQLIAQIGTQGPDGTEVSSLAYDNDVPNLRKALYDRVSILVHWNGAKWIPTNADTPPTIAEAGPSVDQLKSANAWELAFTDINRFGVVKLEVNV